ncbi:MAG: nuclear transport factor 2 family protein [Deltaproteobacteria bacterium]|nr:nuclear transport factor 2 family protein [Deltaproteobacteria bacterium]
MKSTKDIVLGFFGTFANDEGWESMLATDMVFSSPMDKTGSKEEFIPLDKQFRQLVVSASVKWIISEGDQASALVDYKMALPSGDTLDIEFSELIKVEGQKISSIKVLFDTAKFNEFLSKISR